MDDVGDFREWDELVPDALGLIFKKLSLVEVLTVVPGVCKSWGRVVLGPYCWQEIDLGDWSRDREPEIVERMLRLLIPRSSGSLRALCDSGLRSNESILFIANHAQSLQILRLPRSEIENSIIERVAGMLSAVTFLDLSYCLFKRKCETTKKMSVFELHTGAQALEAIGKQCKSLTTLLRRMDPIEFDMISCDDEARAIAATMPNLKHLLISNLPVDTSSVVSILENCKQLELLDIRGCWEVDLDDSFVKRFPKLKVLENRPIMNDWDDWEETLCSRDVDGDFYNSD